MISQKQLIERWENAGRVLDAMPQHERDQHWDMNQWGQRTECGTIACAAGHCGLDPWFRKRGFKLDFKNGEAQISDVQPFFGAEGSWRIFLNSARRSVETVQQEVRDYIAELKRIAALAATIQAPAIGEPWSEQGGIYAGPILGRDGERDYLLIVGPEVDGRINWHDAMKWAPEIVVEKHRDFLLPFRAEQRPLLDRVGSQFLPEWYWSCEQHASYSGLAWFQGFGYGLQSGWYEGYTGRARAVRRIPIR